VVASEEGDMGWVLELQAQKELESFDGVVASVDEVSHEDVARVGNLSTFVEELEQIVELAVNVSADGDWGTHWLHVALFNEDLLDLLTEDAEIALGKYVSSLDGIKPLVDVAGCGHL